MTSYNENCAAPLLSTSFLLRNEKLFCRNVSQKAQYASETRNR
jgi:hypothetical protein